MKISFILISLCTGNHFDEHTLYKSFGFHIMIIFATDLNPQLVTVLRTRTGNRTGIRGNSSLGTLAISLNILLCIKLIWQFGIDTQT